jgi:hypothetical protein
LKSQRESYNARLAWKTRRLARVAGELAQVSDERLKVVCGRVLTVSLDGEHSLFGFSALNNDGSPLQAVLVASESGSEVRLIGDPPLF